MPSSKEPIFLIGVAAKICNMHPQTLRTYEKMELVIPERVGSKNRMYSQEDLERLQQIQRLTQDLGVNLAGVKVILDLLKKMDKMEAEHKSELERLRTIVAKQSEMINRITR